MAHNYYHNDWEMNNLQRLEYFDNQFLSLAGEVAKAKGITISQYLSQIKNITTFKTVLRECFNQDPSLANYVEGMSNRDFQIFFQRDIIQDITKTDIEETEEFIEKVPIDVKQVKKEIRLFFKAKYTEKKTKKIKRTVGYEDEFTRQKKRVRVLRDSLGRFVGKL